MQSLLMDRKVLAPRKVARVTEAPTKILKVNVHQILPTKSITLIQEDFINYLIIN